MLIPISAGLVGAAVAGGGISGATYSGTSFDISAQVNIPRVARFGDSGSKMYVLNFNDIIYQYSLSTAYDISTASYDSKSFTTTTQGGQPYDIAFKSDGTKLYIVNSGGGGTPGGTNVLQYSLSTAWDVSTASYDSVAFDYGTQDGFAGALFFGDSGTKMYVLGFNNASVYQYTLSTAWDLSTASYASKSASLSSQGTSQEGLAFSADGTTMVSLNTSTDDTAYRYTLSTAWDVSTASYDSVSFGLGTQDSSPTGIDFNADATLIIMSGATNDNVYEYTL